ncbi:MAG: aldo/keto reductase [Erysipelotrichaceae bacterium]|nr:aldo/keto reductase [Erysipelotrichaceae bacterium]
MTNKKLGFGTMRLPLLNAEDPASIDLEQYKQMADMFIERGFTYFDTAYMYHKGQSENFFKPAVAERFPRDVYTIADKMPVHHVKGPEDYEKIFNEQLQKCGVEYFDYYLLHNMGRDQYPNTEKFGGFEFMAGLKEKGLAKKIGFSFHDDADTLDKILSEHPIFDFVQLQINYFDWDSAVTQSGKCYETAVRHGKKVVVMEPVKGGTLARLPEEAMKLFNDFYQDEKVSPASLAIRYVASLENVMVVLSGMSALEQMDDNTSYMMDFKPLSEKERKLVSKITDILNGSIKVPCTSCRYCMEVCPMNINIPSYFGLLNLYASTGKKSRMYYERYALDHGKASDCLHCGLCEGNCPQHIQIRDFLEEFVPLYEE